MGELISVAKGFVREEKSKKGRVPGVTHQT
jgi:hypothetical protein